MRFLVALLLLVAVAVHADRRALLLSKRSAAAAYSASSIDYSGTNQNVKFTGSAVTMSGAGQSLTISIWVNPDTDGTSRYLAQGRNGTSGPQWRANLTTTDQITVVVTDSASATVLSMTTGANTVKASSGWVHFYMSVDLSSTGNRAVYVAGTNATVTWGTYNTAGVMALDRTDFISGTDDSNGSDYDGQLAELWVDDAYWAAGTYVSSFIDGSGNPKNLGSDGSTPTGSSPDIYMRFISGSLGVNSGADGGTGTLNGPPTSGPSFP